MHRDPWPRERPRRRPRCRSSETRSTSASSACAVRRGPHLRPAMAALPTEPLQITEPLRGRNDTRRNLVGLSREELKTTLTEAGLEPFRARQVWQWIYWRGITDFERM